MPIINEWIVYIKVGTSGCQWVLNGEIRYVGKMRIWEDVDWNSFKTLG